MNTREVPNGGGSRTGRAVTFVLHTLLVYIFALHISGWLVSRWFAWVAPLLHISVSVPPADWYLQHLELVTVLPALVAGYFNVLRVAVAGFRLALAWMDGPQDSDQSASVAVWAWTIPALILCYKMLAHRASNSSVLDDRSFYEATMPTIRYFFVIQQEVPRFWGNSISGDPVRALAQMTVTAPFYAGVSYSVGALAAKYDVLTKLFSFHTPGDPEPDSATEE